MLEDLLTLNRSDQAPQPIDYSQSLVDDQRKWRNFQFGIVDGVISTIEIDSKLNKARVRTVDGQEAIVIGKIPTYQVAMKIQQYLKNELGKKEYTIGFELDDRHEKSKEYRRILIRHKSS